MTVYNFLTVAAKSHSAIVGGGKTDDISVDLNSGCIYSGSKMIVVASLCVLARIAMIVFPVSAFSYST